MPILRVIEHPLVARSLTILRDASTDAATFRLHLRLIARLMTPAVTDTVPTDPVTVATPLQEASGSVLRGPIVLAPILRAGLGMADGLLEMIPDARVAHLGLRRDETTLEPEVYSEDYPADLPQSQVILIDPMLATGGSSIVAADLLRRRGATAISFFNLVSCPKGIEAFHERHPAIPIITAAVDAGLNEQAYIVPGLGDAGDRYFDTGKKSSSETPRQ